VGFEGFGDEFRTSWDAPRRGLDLGFAMVNDGAFSPFLDSPINKEDQFVDYFGDRKNADQQRRKYL
jgi:hypothetical protein